MELWVILAEDLFWLHVIIVFVYGALMGSFFNVCIYRLPIGQSVNKPSRSFCPSCGSMIAWYDNIPLYSYLNLRGLCRHCGVQFSSRYFWIELLTAVLFVGVFWRHGYTAATLLFILLTSFLIISTFTDLDHWIIPDAISLGGAVVGLLASAAAAAWAAHSSRPLEMHSLKPYIAYPFDSWGAWGIAANSLGGAVAGYGMLWLVGVIGTLVFRKEAMGMGDMKLFACIGAFMGWQASLFVLALASFIGATIGLSLIAAQWIIARISPAHSSLPPAGAPVPEEATDKTEVEERGGDHADENEPTSSEFSAGEAVPTPQKSRRLHHLPFGPSIAIAAYIVALYQKPITEWMARHLLLTEFLR